MGEVIVNFIIILYKGGYISIDDFYLVLVRIIIVCRYFCGFINISNIFNYLIKKNGFIIVLMMYCSVIFKDILY